MLSYIRLFFKSDRPLRIALHGILGFYPGKIQPYKLALKHRGGTASDNNERLEFLGDALLGAVTADILYHRYTDRNEGFLTSARSRVVSRETLNRIAIEMGLDRLIRNALPGNVDATNLPGNTLEAIVGAICIDRGYSECRRFVETRLLPHVGRLDEVQRLENNHKSRLLEFCQKRRLELEYKVEACTDSTGQPAFRAVAFVAGRERGTGIGPSKKAATQAAAAKALQEFARRKKRKKPVAAAAADEKTDEK